MNENTYGLHLFGKNTKERKLINIHSVEQDLSQGQNSSPDSALPIT